MTDKPLTIRMPLSKGFFALIDASDYEAVSKYKWYLVMNEKGNPYARRCLPKVKDRPQSQRLHNFLMNPAPGLLVDHINRDGLDCRRENMRVCTQAENNRNTRKYKNSASKYKGIYFNKKMKRWTAYICINGKRIYAGCSKIEADAAKCYDRLATKHFGEFAYLNFPVLSDIPNEYSNAAQDGQKEE